MPLWGSYEKERTLQALDLLGQAIERDPHYGPALALAAHCHHVLHAGSLTDDPETTRREGTRLARRAFQCSPDDPEVLAFAGFVLGYFDEDINLALGLIDRSLALNPSFARGWMWSGVLRNFAGQPYLAIEHCKTSLRLSPRDRIGMSGLALGAGYFFVRQFDEAEGILLSSLEHQPSFAVVYRLLASCYAHMGRLDDARKMIVRLRQITPIVIPSITPYRNTGYRELFLSGLRLASGDSE